ncbi:MAG: hypothetical protein IPG63_18765 [Xanthomonadales bacterium]|nr:hypothetical protein [Xanthomonadales bacterium]MBK7144777.1 hypothetical protein [Xanthomonadales bacterium]MCC6562657.1 hypothetical protein [Xanthomonadales bacterium]
MSRRVLWVAIGVLALVQGWDAWTHRALPRPAGVLVASEPLQRELDRAQPLLRDAFTLTPLATFEFEARVLLVSRYRFDEESALSPLDLGIGWGRMSDTAVIEQLGLQQSVRFLTWRWRDAPPIPEAEITRSAANIHVIPANSVVERQIAALRPGQIVAAKGVLVEATRDDGWRWRSSLSRDDGGNGACELMYVESISIKD